jgi:predicted nucleic acid-binding protein
MINDFVLDVASALVDRHALRAYDAIQLAGYVALRGSTGTDVPVFVCSDHALLEAARLEGIPILDPASGP